MHWGETAVQSWRMAGRCSLQVACSVLCCRRACVHIAQWAPLWPANPNGAMQVEVAAWRQPQHACIACMHASVLLYPRVPLSPPSPCLQPPGSSRLGSDAGGGGGESCGADAGPKLACTCAVLHRSRVVLILSPESGSCVERSWADVRVGDVVKVRARLPPARADGGLCDAHPPAAKQGVLCCGTRGGLGQRHAALWSIH